MVLRRGESNEAECAANVHGARVDDKAITNRGPAFDVRNPAAANECCGMAEASSLLSRGLPHVSKRHERPRRRRRRLQQTSMQQSLLEHAAAAAGKTTDGANEHGKGVAYGGGADGCRRDREGGAKALRRRHVKIEAMAFEEVTVTQQAVASDDNLPALVPPFTLLPLQRPPTQLCEPAPAEVQPEQPLEHVSNNSAPGACVVMALWPDQLQAMAAVSGAAPTMPISPEQATSLPTRAVVAQSTPPTCKLLSLTVATRAALTVVIDLDACMIAAAHGAGSQHSTVVRNQRCCLQRYEISGTNTDSSRIGKAELDDSLTMASRPLRACASPFTPISLPHHDEAAAFVPNLAGQRPSLQQQHLALALAHQPHLANALQQQSHLLRGLAAAAFSEGNVGEASAKGSGGDRHGARVWS
jgi:hypothetical protein